MQLSIPASRLKSSSLGASLHHSSIIGLKLYSGSAHAIQSTIDFAFFKSYKRVEQWVTYSNAKLFFSPHVQSQIKVTSNMIALMPSCWTFTTTSWPLSRVALWTCAICIKADGQSIRTVHLSMYQWREDKQQCPEQSALLAPLHTIWETYRCSCQRFFHKIWEKIIHWYAKLFLYSLTNLSKTIHFNWLSTVIWRINKTLNSRYMQSHISIHWKNSMIILKPIYSQ